MANSHAKRVNASGEEATHVMEILMGVLESAAYGASLPRSQALSAECPTVSCRSSLHLQLTFSYRSCQLSA